MGALAHARSDTVWQEDYKGFTIAILPDYDPENPRTEWDNLSTIVGWHRRYTFGDTTPRTRNYTTYHEHFYSDDGDAEDFLDWLKTHDAIVLPIFMYEHSGVALRTSSFFDPWDSGQVGYIYVTKEAIREEWKVKRISPKLRATIIANLRAEVETYSYYLNGEVYGYAITKSHHTDNDDDDDTPEDTKNGDLDLDSCFGYYGHDDVLAAAKEAIDAHIAHTTKKGAHTPC